MGDVTAQRLRLAVLASGRGSNFRAIAKRCRDDDFPAEVACLITDRPSSEAVAIAEEFGIPWHHVNKGKIKGRLEEGGEAEIVRICNDAGVGLIVLAGFMRILRDDVLDRFADRIINIHPSLLPSFKGLNGPKQALEYGAKVAGATVHFVDRSVDGGAIILQAVVNIADNDTVETLHAKIQKEEHRILCHAVELIAQDKLTIEGRAVKGADEHRT